MENAVLFYAGLGGNELDKKRQQHECVDEKLVVSE